MTRVIRILYGFWAAVEAELTSFSAPSAHSPRLFARVVSADIADGCHQIPPRPPLPPPPRLPTQQAGSCHRLRHRAGRTPWPRMGCLILDPLWDRSSVESTTELPSLLDTPEVPQVPEVRRPAPIPSSGLLERIPALRQSPLSCLRRGGGDHARSRRHARRGFLERAVPDQDERSLSTEASTHSLRNHAEREFIVADVNGVAGLTNGDQGAARRLRSEEGRTRSTEQSTAAVRGAHAASG